MSRHRVAPLEVQFARAEERQRRRRQGGGEMSRFEIARWIVTVTTILVCLSQAFLIYCLIRWRRAYRALTDAIKSDAGEEK